MDNHIIDEAKAYIKKEFTNEGTGHDWYHIERVYRMATYLQSKEGGNLTVIKFAALFHDFTDSKLKKDTEQAQQLMEAWFRNHHLSEEQIRSILSIIENVSFSHERAGTVELDLESKIVQDADRLDAIGAIGIARCFTYGGAKGRPIYSLENMESSSIQHFYDKLLIIKDRIKTNTAKQIAHSRHETILAFLKSIKNECDIQI
ncbi:HD domain-containing protein [Listeria rocourtiae]|uniref:HD domain-containing protein n=1 Tax=Listeria rocourtiae TaxID=647910 RepID=UPI003D2F696A